MKLKKTHALTTLCFLFLFATGDLLADNHSPIGAKIMDFTVAVTSVTYLEDKTLINVQSAGALGEFGIVGGTITFYPGIDPSGTVGLYTTQGAAFRADDKVVTFSGKGSWKGIGKHRWRLNGTSVNIEGLRSYLDAVLSLEGMSLSGGIYSLD